MTGFLHEREFSRKTFLKGGGALIVGLSAAGAAGKAAAAGIDPFASPGPGDPNAVDSFLIIHSDNTASLLFRGDHHQAGCRPLAELDAPGEERRSVVAVDDQERVDGDNTASLLSGRIELGQGS